MLISQHLRQTLYQDLNIELYGITILYIIGIIMKNIVEIENSNLVVTLNDIAKFSGNKYESIRRLMIDNRNEFEELGIEYKTKRNINVDFKSIKLNEEQTTFLLILMRNNPTVIKFKFNLVKQFMALKDMICETNQHQLIEKNDTIKRLRASRYAKPRAGKFQTVDRIRQNYDINLSTHELNEILLKKNILINQPAIVNNYLPNENDTRAIRQGRATLVNENEAIAIFDNTEEIIRGRGWVDENPTLLL